jgi:hypothetical protein
MSDKTPRTTGSGPSLDTWAVLLAIALALVVRFDLLKKVPW